MSLRAPSTLAALLAANPPASLADIPHGVRGLVWLAWASLLGATLERRVVKARGSFELGSRGRYRVEIHASRPEDTVLARVTPSCVLASTCLGVFQADDDPTYQRLLALTEAHLAQLRDPLLAVTYLAPKT